MTEVLTDYLRQLIDLAEDLIEEIEAAKGGHQEAATPARLCKLIEFANNSHHWLVQAQRAVAGKWQPPKE